VLGRWFCGGGLESEGGFALMLGVEFFEEALDGADGLVVAELGGRGEDAVLGVVSDFGDGFGGLLLWVGLGQIQAGDLKAVEEDAAAARVDFVGGDAAEDFADGVLDGGAVFRDGEGEAGATAFARGGFLDGAAGVVVVVAEGFGAVGAAESGAAAAAAVGEEVTALEASVVGVGAQDFGVHGVL